MGGSDAGEKLLSIHPWSRPRVGGKDEDAGLLDIAIREALRRTAVAHDHDGYASALAAREQKPASEGLKRPDSKSRE